MVTLVKHEWHSHDRQYAIELDEALLSEIYPDLDDDEIANMLEQIENGDITVDEVVEAAYENDVELEWDFQYDDCWTDRKGGYDVTYELGDDSSWHEPEKEPDPTHKCTKCKWKGSKYETQTQYLREDGTVIENYFESDEDSHSTKDVCPMCDSELELTEEGARKEEEYKKLVAELDSMDVEEDDSTIESTHPAGEYTIRIWGRTREIGVGKITKEQYDYWSDEEREYDLAEALNENFDYDENETPEKARFESPYYDYNEVHSIYGFDDDDTVMTITNSDGEEIYNGSLISFFDEVHGEEDSRWEVSDETEELYPQYLGKGYFVYWTQGGKGSCLQTTIDTGTDEFDLKKLRYKYWDVEGNSIVTNLEYNGQELYDEGMDSEHDNWRGQWSDYSVHWNKE